MYDRNYILFSFYIKHIIYYIYVCNIMCISITGLGLKLHFKVVLKSLKCNFFISAETLLYLNTNLHCNLAKL